MWLLVNLFVFLYISKISADTLPCTTPEGKQGSCVFVDYCPSVIKSFQTVKLTREPVKLTICNETTASVCCTEPRNSSSYGRELTDRQYCGYQQFDNYESTRNITSIDEFPWLAAILGIDSDTDEEHIFCHGSLINRRYLLSAAQCFFSLNVWRFSITRVLLGKYHRNPEKECVELPELKIMECAKPEEFQIEKTIIHPFYFRGFRLADIALIRLNRVVIFTDYIRPICLPIQGMISGKPGDILYTTGWGRTTVQGEDAVVKKKIATVLIPNEECHAKYKKVELLSDIGYICSIDSKNNTAYSCSGDSGAPVMFNHRNQWQIEGIVSRGAECGNYAPGAHTRVAGYLEWIKQNMKP